MDTRRSKSQKEDNTLHNNVLHEESTNENDENVYISPSTGSKEVVERLTGKKQHYASTNSSLRRTQLPNLPSVQHSFNAIQQGSSSQFIFTQLREAPDLKSFKDIEQGIHERWYDYPPDLLPRVTHLLINMRYRGLPWANIVNDAIHLTPDIPAAVAQQCLENYDKAMRRNLFPNNNNRGKRGGLKFFTFFEESIE